MIDFLQEKNPDLGFVEAAKQAGLEDEVLDGQAHEPSDEDQHGGAGPRSGPPAEQRTPPANEQSFAGRLAAEFREEQEKQRKQREREKRKQEEALEKERQRTRRNLNDADEEMLRMAGSFRRTRRALRMIRRFCFLHADVDMQQWRADPEPPSTTARMAMIPDFVPKEDHPDLSDEPYCPLTTKSNFRSHGDAIGPGGIVGFEFKQDNFAHVRELFAAIAGGLEDNFLKAHRLDREESQRRINILLDAAKKNTCCSPGAAKRNGTHP